MSHNIQYLQQK